MTERTKLIERQKAMADAERESLQLESLTIDALTPGQQQPESDHFLQAERSDMGIHQGHHWRHAEGWFSYVLNDKAREASKLQITYFAGDSGRNFTISIDETVIADVSLQAKPGEDFYTVDYAIPSELVKAAREGKLVLKFTAKKDSIAGGIYGVRLLRE